MTSVRDRLQNMKANTTPYRSESAQRSSQSVQDRLNNMKAATRQNEAASAGLAAGIVANQAARQAVHGRAGAALEAVEREMREIEQADHTGKIGSSSITIASYETAKRRMEEEEQPDPELLRRYEALQTQRDGLRDAAYWEDRDQLAAALERAGRGSTDFQDVVDRATSETWKSANVLMGNANARNVAVDIQLLARGETQRGTDEIDGAAKYMTPDQRDTFMYYAGTDQWDKATEYLDSIEHRLNAQQAQELAESTRKVSENNPLLGALTNIGAGFLTPLSWLDTAGHAVVSGITGEYTPTDPNSQMHIGPLLSQSSREGVMAAAEHMPLLGDIEIGGRNLGSEVAGVGLSIGQVASRLPFGGAGALALSAGSAAGEQSYNVLQRGGTQAEAAFSGLASGLIEAATEKIGLDNLFSVLGRTGRQGVRQVLSDVARQAGIEATEEAISEVANNLADIAIMGENSELNQYILQLERQGMSPTQARNEALKQFFLINTAWSAAGGALSGGVMGGGASVLNGLTTRGVQQNTQTQQDAAQEPALWPGVVLPTADQNGMLPRAEIQTPDTEAQRLSQSAQGQNTAASTGETGTLVERIRQSIPQIQNAQPVATIDGSEIPSGGKIVDRLVRFVNSIGNKVNRPGFGDVLFSKGRIKNSMIGHGIGNAKIETFAAVPAVIENGTQIDYQPNWKGRVYDTYTFAAPINYRGQTSYLGVVVTKDTQDGRYYVHEVVDGNGSVIYRGNENTEPTSDGRSGQQADLDTVVSSVSGNSIPQTGQNVNTQANNSASDPGAVPAGPGVRGVELGPESTVGAAESGFDRWSHFQNQSSQFIPEGANAARPVDVPVRDPDGNLIRRTASTAMGAKAIPDEVVKDIQDMVLTGKLSYEQVSNRDSTKRAVQRIQEDGFQRSLEYFTSQVKKGLVSKDLTTLGQQLLVNAANAGDGKATAELLTLYAQMETSAGQAVQAASILRKLAPDDQLYGIQQTVTGLEREIQKRYKDQEITIDPGLIEDFLAQTDQDGRDKVMGQIYQNIADQVPANWREKWNAWRYLAMLFNPRTHVRNVMGNLLFQPVRMVKDRVAATAETLVGAINPNFQKTKSFAANPALYKEAWNDWANVKDILSGNKYDDIRSEINSRRTIFNGPILKPIEAARKGNSWALEFEDSIFKRITYADALSGYLQANGITAQQLSNGEVNNDLLSRARDYAGQEALRATYQDRNQFSDLLSRRFREDGTMAKVANAAMDAVLPFRRTPANILVRGFEYSPAGLAKALTSDMVQVARGKISGAEAIDHIASGLTGSALFALGAYLLSEGIVTSGGSDEEEQNDLNELTGLQNYALNLPGGSSVTLDWLAPEALPFFMGVELMDTIGNGGFSGVDDILSALGSISEPMLELSMLQSLNDLIDSVSYAESSGKLVSMAGSALISYLTQAIPTLGGQIERTTEENRMSSFTDRDSSIPRDLQYAISRSSARLPGDFQQIPYIDAWGRTESNGNILARAFNNFLNPAYTSALNVTAADEEIQRLLDAGQTGVVPDRVSQSQKVDGEYLTSEQYVEYATTRGQTAYDIVSDMIENDLYRAMTDEQKADAIKRAYQYAGHVAAQAISPEHESDPYVAAARSADNAAEYLLLYEKYGSIGIKRYSDLMGAGLDAESAATVLDTVDSLTPAEGADSVTSLQRYRAIVDSGVSQEDQLAALSQYMSDSDYEKLSTGYGYGVTPDAYVTFRETLPSFDSNGNGSLTQAETEVALDALGGWLILPGSSALTNNQKAVLWQLQGKNWSWRNNPYNTAIGRQVYNALNSEESEDFAWMLNLPRA